MAKQQKRISFSIVRDGKCYRIQCNETAEFVTGKMDSKCRAERVLKEHVNTRGFVETLKDLTVKEVAERVKLFGGRLRPYKKPWTIEEARLVAKIYNSRGEMYEKNKKLYLCGYQKGWLDELCAHMKPSRKKNKFVYGVLNPNTALAKIFDYPTHYEFTRANQSAYDALRRFGVDTVELFDNRDNALYLQSIIKQLAADQVEKFTT